MKSETRRWALGLAYIFAVASIWIAASFVVQSVVDAGVSPFLVTYICNSLFIIYIPLVEIYQCFEDKYWNALFLRNSTSDSSLPESEEVVPLQQNAVAVVQAEASDTARILELKEITHDEGDVICKGPPPANGGFSLKGLNDKGRWTRARVAKVSLLICPFWFLAQLAFNLSLKYTTVTSNTILSSSSSLFTFLVSLLFLGERFTWVKLISVLLCMGGTIIVSLGDSKAASGMVASNPALGDIFAVVSAAFYAAYITLIRKKLPDDDGKDGHVSTAQFLGFLGFFNFLIFFPVALILNFTKMESFYVLTWKQLGLIVGKGLLDNVLSDYLWAKAVLLTTTTVASAGLSIQVPLAAIVDSVMGNSPNPTDYIGATAVMVGFAGINIPSDTFLRSNQETIEAQSGDLGPNQSGLDFSSG